MLTCRLPYSLPCHPARTSDPSAARRPTPSGARSLDSSPALAAHWAHNIFGGRLPSCADRAASARGAREAAPSLPADGKGTPRRDGRRPNSVIFTQVKSGLACGSCRRSSTPTGPRLRSLGCTSARRRSTSSSVSVLVASAQKVPWSTNGLDPLSAKLL